MSLPVSAPDTKDPLLQPLTIRHITFRNRVMSTSHACGLEEGGLPKEAYQAYHEEKARGGIGLTMFGGSSNVSPDSPNVFRQLYVGSDEIIEYFQQFSERVHSHGAKLMCQITHLGRRGESFSDRVLPTIAPSMVRETLHRSFPKEMDRHDIKRVIQDFADAAWRCQEGGLDGIETLAGGHLIGQFLSPATNFRTDSYGGSLENRCRFGLEVYEAMRERVGDDFLVGIRFHVDEGYKEGLDFEDSLQIAKVFESSGTIDFFNANYGRMDTYVGLATHNMPGMASPIAPWVEKAGAFKQEMNLPVFHAARINDLATARYAIKEGLLDMAAMTRAHIADPHLVNKLKQGEEHRVRPCVGATHCMGGTTRPSCIHNPVTGRELALSQTTQPSAGPAKRIVVVGGGPAGLEAARIAAERGHKVVLFEAANQLGGQVLLAVKASWRRDFIGVVDWRAAELEHLNVDVRLNHYADAASVEAEDPDVVIIATGGVPNIDWIDGSEHVTSVWDVLTGSAKVQDTALIYDGTGRHAALTAAEFAKASGADVQFIAIDDHLGMEMAYAENVIWRRRSYELELSLEFNHRLLRVEKFSDGVAATFRNEMTDIETTLHARQLIVEHGTEPVTEVYDELRGRSTNDGVTDPRLMVEGKVTPESGSGYEVHRIGDAVSSRNVHTAILDATRLMTSI